MSFLNLMRNKLKPKEVNDALMNFTNPPAEDVTYDNDTSGLTATDVQSAIDELNTSIGLIPVIKKVTRTGTTTNAGKLNINDIAPENILSMVSPSGAHYYFLWRESATAGRTVALVLDEELAPVTETEVSVKITYI